MKRTILACPVAAAAEGLCAYQDSAASTERELMARACLLPFHPLLHPKYLGLSPYNFGGRLPAAIRNSE